MKKTLAIIIAIAITASVLSIFAGAEVSSIGIIDFDDYNFNNGYYVLATEANGNKYAKLNVASPSRNGVVFKPAGNISLSEFTKGTKWIWSFDLLIDPTVEKERVCFYVGNARVDFNDDQYIDVYTTVNGSKHSEYSTNTGLINGWNHISINIEIVSGGAAEYVIILNGKTVSSWYKKSGSKLSVPDFTANGDWGVPDGIEMYMEKTGGDVGIDNINFSSSFKGEVGSDFERASKTFVMMYVNRPNVWRYGEAGYISKDRKQVPYYSADGSIMVPVSYFAGCFGGSAVDSGSKSKITISGKTATVASVKKNGVRYASVSEMCKKFGKYLHTEANGLFAFGNKNADTYLNWNTYLKDMRNLVRSFIFDRYSGDDIYNALVSTTASKSHPRLTYTEAEFAKIRKNIKSSNGDPVYKAMYQQIINASESYMNTSLYKYSKSDGIRLDETGLVRCRIVNPALAYNLTLNEKYAKRAYSEMEAICKFKDLNPYHFLDVGQISCALAYGYDLLYNWMSNDQRTFIRQNIVRLVINVALYDVKNQTVLGQSNDSRIGTGKIRSYIWNGDDTASNWRFVVGCGVGCSVLAVVDELGGEDKENAKEVLGAMLNYMQPELMLFAPFGAYEEGLAYWEFGLTYYTFFMKALMSSCGTDFGYVDIPGLNMTNDFLIALNGNAACFTYHHDFDMASDRFSPPVMFFAEYFGKYDQGALRTELIKSGKVDRREDPFRDFILYSPVLKNAKKTSLKCDDYFPVSEDAMMRTGWEKNDIYVGLHCDRPYGNGGSGAEPYDAGLFVLQGLGEKWFFDQGRDNYELSPIKNTYWFRAEGHNTVIFNPDKNPEMKEYGEAYISDFSSSGTVSYAVGNMTKAYKSAVGVTDFKRGVKLNKKLGVVTVQDEIKLSKNAEMYWFAHTDAKITVSADGKSATLTKNGKKLNAKIVNGENATFSVMDAKPLPTSPTVAGQRTLDGITKLTVHIKNCGSINLCVQFSFGSNTAVDDFKLISEWKSAYPPGDDGEIEKTDGKIESTEVIDGITTDCVTDLTTEAAGEESGSNVSDTGTSDSGNGVTSDEETVSEDITSVEGSTTGEDTGNGTTAADADTENGSSEPKNYVGIIVFAVIAVFSAATVVTVIAIKKKKKL